MQMALPICFGNESSLNGREVDGERERERERERKGIGESRVHRRRGAHSRLVTDRNKTGADRLSSPPLAHTNVHAQGPVQATADAMRRVSGADD
jgi:hypothetical protein